MAAFAELKIGSERNKAWGILEQGFVQPSGGWHAFCAGARSEGGWEGGVRT